MSLQRNYYEVLGIPQGATTDQIKKKYRELARKFHPDVVQDKVLGQRVFSQINQAYRVLADPERREQYNSQLAATSNAARPTPAATPPRPSQPGSSQMRPAQPTPTQNRPTQTAPTPTGAGQPRPQAAPSGAAATPQAGAANGTRPAAPTNGTRPSAPSGAGQSGDSQKAQAVAGLLANADNSIMAGKPIEARVFCIRVLEIDPKNVRALEMLGDALAGMGKREDAAVQYRNALAISPSSLIQSKLDRLEQAATSTRTNPPQSGSQRTNPPGGDGDKPGGLFGRFLGRK